MTQDGHAPEGAKPKRRTRSERPRGDRLKRRPIALPVLVVDETVLLPHMSIPFPIEDDEAAMVIDRALRMPLRQILVLTEREVQKPQPGQEGSTDGDFRTLTADFLADLGVTPRPSSKDDEPLDWVPDDELPGNE
ncbi:MAG: hypothetical protein C4345_11605, partial [Chloroflexota bacterium]